MGKELDEKKTTMACAEKNRTGLREEREVLPELVLKAVLLNILINKHGTK